MTQSRRKIDGPERVPSRAEAVPGTKPKSASKKRDPYASMSYEEAYQAFDNADLARKKVETVVQELRSQTLNGGGVSETTRRKLEKAMSRLEELDDLTEEMRLVASRKFEKEALPATFEMMTEEDAFKAFLEAEDEYRAAEKHLREVKKEIFKKNGTPTKEQRAELREAEQALFRAQDQLEGTKQLAKKKNEEAHLKLEEEREAPEPEVEELHGSEAERIELVDYDQRISDLEVAIDDLREAGKDKELREKVHELAELKAERGELESRMREREGAGHAASFERQLEAAKQDEYLATSAREYEDLSHHQTKLEKQIKKMTGHDAEQINLNPSLAGGLMERFGHRLKGFFSKLAGMKPEPHADDLMREWKAVSRRMEELAMSIQPTPSYEAQVKAQAKPKMVDTEKEAERAVSRINMKEREAEFLTEAMDLVSDIKHELREIELYDDRGLILEHQERHTKNLERFEDKHSLLESFESSNDQYDELVTSATDLLKTLQDRFRAKIDEASEQARRAGKGKRIFSFLPNKARSVEPRSTFGIEALTQRHPRVELSRKAGPKTELGAEDEYIGDILKYREEHAAEIRTVMQEYPQAARLWEDLRKRLAGISQEDYAKLSKLFGTRDVATACVLDTAFAVMDLDKKAFARARAADKILGFLAEPYLPSVIIDESQEPRLKKKGKRKRKSRKDKGQRAA